MLRWWDLLVGEVRFASGMIVVLGVWEILAPFVLGYSGSTVPTINAIVVGVLAVILGLARYRGAYTEAWMSRVQCVLGFWLIIAPFILSYGNPARINDIIVGVVITFFGALGTVASSQAETYLGWRGR
jgi:hypothetical protein